MGPQCLVEESTHHVHSQPTGRVSPVGPHARTAEALGADGAAVWQRLCHGVPVLGRLPLAPSPPLLCG